VLCACSCVGDPFRLRLNHFGLRQAFALLRSVEIISVVISAVQGAELAQKQNTDCVVVYPIGSFAEPPRFGPNRLVNYFLETGEDTAEIASVLTFECCSCRLLDIHFAPTCFAATGGIPRCRTPCPEARTEAIICARFLGILLNPATVRIFTGSGVNCRMVYFRGAVVPSDGRNCSLVMK
jgi:hypothetical protein